MQDTPNLRNQPPDDLVARHMRGRRPEAAREVTLACVTLLLMYVPDMPDMVDTNLRLGRPWLRRRLDGAPPGRYHQSTVIL